MADMACEERSSSDLVITWVGFRGREERQNKMSQGTPPLRHQLEITYLNRTKTETLIPDKQVWGEELSKLK